MNEYQSPYIDGQVIPPEDAEPSLHGFESSQPLSVPGKKIQGCSKSASECLQKTKQLAHEFNHGTYCAAHLVLAMTLIPNATRQFDLRKVDIEKAFRAAMHALTEMERGSPNHRNVPRPSEELSMIVGLAEEVAKNRDNQEVSVDDLLTAVDRMPPETSAAQLLRGERKGIPDLMIRESLMALSDNVGAQVHGIGTQIQNLQLQMQSLEQDVRSAAAASPLRFEIGDLKAELARQCSELDRKLGEMAARLAQRLESPAPATPPSPPEAPPPPKPTGGIWDRLVSP